MGRDESDQMLREIEEKTLQLTLGTGFQHVLRVYRKFQLSVTLLDPKIAYDKARSELQSLLGICTATTVSTVQTMRDAANEIGIGKLLWFHSNKFLPFF